MTSRYLRFVGQQRFPQPLRGVPFYCCDGGLVVLCGENPNRILPVWPLQSHYCERTVPGEPHSFVDGAIPGTITAVSGHDQEPVNTVKCLYHDLAPR